MTLLICCILGEVVFCSANPILKYTQDDLSQRGVFGTLFCTNFRVTFLSEELTQEEKVRTHVRAVKTRPDFTRKFYCFTNGNFILKFDLYKKKKKP